MEFDDSGALINCVKGVKEKRKDTYPNMRNVIQLDIYGDQSESDY